MDSFLEEVIPVLNPDRYGERKWSGKKMDKSQPSWANLLLLQVPDGPLQSKPCPEALLGWERLPGHLVPLPPRRPRPPSPATVVGRDYRAWFQLSP